MKHHNSSHSARNVGSHRESVKVNLAGATATGDPVKPIPEQTASSTRAAAL